MKISDLDICKDKELELISSIGDIELYPPQEDAINAGLLEREQNFVIATPTASGKTLLAELVMLKSILTASGKCLYVVPLNALAYEKYRSFKDKYSFLRIGISTGDYESSSRYLAGNDIIILTLEKFDSLTRLKPSWMRGITVLVVDEVHVIGEDKRGPRLEGAIARFLSFNPSMRVIALSATIQNADEFANWLHAYVVKSEWRPVPLKEEVFVAPNDSIIVERVLEEVKNGSQALVFVNTKRGAASFARKLAKLMDSDPSLDELAERVDIGIDDLGEMVRHGVAYHNSWLHPEQRHALEEAFLAHRLKVICCTPTLAMGVSLPAKVVLIRNYKFFTPGRGTEPMPVCWVKQVFGRAGRPEHDDYGLGLIVARDEAERSEIEQIYINGEPERIESQFSQDSLTEQILATIVAGARSAEQIEQFLDSTFYAYQEGTKVAVFKEQLNEILLDLELEGLIRIDKDNGDIRLRPTEFGKLSSRLYLSINSALDLREGLTSLKSKLQSTLSDFELLLLLCRCEEVPPLRVKEALTIATSLTDNLELVYASRYALGSAIVAHAWINELSYQELKSKFGVYPGEVHTNLYVLEWLSYAAARIARYLGFEPVYARLNELEDRIRHGVRHDLLDLVKIKGVGRVIARNLYSAGFRTHEEVAKADLARLKRIPGVGTRRATKLKEEALMVNT